MCELVSIIMPAFNAQNTIKESIDSVLNQTISDFKLYIVNDASSDNTENIIRSYSDARIVYIASSINEGVSLTRNKALRVCKGKYIAFLDSDDVWEPKKLELQLKKLNDGWDLVCANYNVFTNIDTVINRRKFPEVINFSDMLKSNYIGNLTGIYNAEKIGIVEQLPCGHEDYVMWLNIIGKTHKAYCIQESLANYRVSKSSLSGNKVKALKWQWSIYRDILKFSIAKSAYYFCWYVINAINKRA